MVKKLNLCSKILVKDSYVWFYIISSNLFEFHHINKNQTLLNNSFSIFVCTLIFLFSLKVKAYKLVNINRIHKIRVKTNYAQRLLL